MNRTVPNGFFLIALLGLVIACGTPTSSRTTGSTGTAPTTPAKKSAIEDIGVSPDPEKDAAAYQHWLDRADQIGKTLKSWIEIQDLNVVPFRDAQGNDTQMILITYRNAGPKAVARVEADLVLMDEKGNRLEPTIPIMVFYKTAASEMIQPGTSYSETDDGWIVVRMPGEGKVVKANATVTNVRPIELVPETVKGF